MKNVFIIAILLFANVVRAETSGLALNESETAVNVIFIMTDDLNDYPGAFGGHPQAKTPNIDRLATSGVQFTNAQSNIAVCQPSRNSLFTGVYPFHSNDFGWTPHTEQAVIKESKTIMQLFQENGYQTLGTGKLLHNNKNDFSVWDEWGNPEKYNYGPFPKSGSDRVAHAGVPEPYSEFGSVDGSFGPLSSGADGLDGWVYGWDLKTFNYTSEENRDLFPDEMHAQWVSDKLAELEAGSSNQPFFMGVGFVNPHTPLIAPDKYFGMFPLESLNIDDYLLNDTVDTYYRNNFSANKKGLKYYSTLLESYNGDRELAIKSFLQAYLACVAFMDEQVGVVLDALDNSRFKDSTIVIFTSDHGWQMGEKGYLFKNSGWEESMRVPYIIKTPDNADVAGGKVDQPVSLIDIYPTLVDYCSLTGDNKKSSSGGELGGHSLRPFLENPDTTGWDGPNGAVSIIGNTGKTTLINEQNYSYRTKQWRYILYTNGNEELYNHNPDSPEYDPYEWYNVAYNNENNTLKETFIAELEAVIGSVTGNGEVVLPVPAEPAEIIIQPREARTYYIDATNGSDENSGLTPDLAWATTEKVSSSSFYPGDSILFKAGEIWDGQLLIDNKGTSDKPIVFTQYGEGDKPLINGNGAEIYTVKLEDTSYTEFSEFKVTNTGEASMAGRLGVYITAMDGDIPGVVLKNVEVYGINGEVDKTKKSKSTGAGSGIYWSNKGSENGRLVDALIEGCHVHHCERNGICGAINRDIKHMRLLVKQNLVEQVPGDGIIMNTCDSSIAEYNICRDFPNKLPDGNAAAGIWPFNSDNTIIQFNEVSGHNAPYDGQGFDSDYRCNNTTIQYNYSHDNSGGFLLICCNKSNLPEGEPSTNIGSVVRYNISIDDGNRTWGPGANIFPSIYFHGVPRNSKIYNNTIYMSDKSEYLNGEDLYFIRVPDWGVNSGWADSIFVYNNIFASVTPAKVEMTKSTNNFFEHNLFYNLTTITDNNGTLPNTNAILSDPGFVNMGGTAVDDYKLKDDSPAIAKGRVIENSGGLDFFGNLIPQESAPCIGAYHTEITTGMGRMKTKQKELFMLYPTITDSIFRMNISEPMDNVIIRIISLTGQVLMAQKYSHLELGNLQFNAINYADGMYIVSLETAHGKQAKRFIKRNQ